MAQPVSVEEKTEEIPPKNLFGGLAAALKDTNKDAQNASGAFSFTFGGAEAGNGSAEASKPTPESDEAKSGFSFSFGTKAAGGFASLAKNSNENAFSGGGFSFANKGKSIFGLDLGRV